MGFFKPQKKPHKYTALAWTPTSLWGLAATLKIFMLFVCLFVCLDLFVLPLCYPSVAICRYSRISGQTRKDHQRPVQCLSSRGGRTLLQSCWAYPSIPHTLPKLMSRCSYYNRKAPVMVGLFQSSMEMPVESIKGNPALGHRHWLARGPKMVQLVQKRPGQKVLTGHITHPTDSGWLPREGTLLRGGRHRWPQWGFSTAFTHLAMEF